jgi:F0F1-type ATP synthase membrane subunit c/vacuolar-type H+-ATPase subunit K
LAGLGLGALGTAGTAGTAGGAGLEALAALRMAVRHPLQVPAFAQWQKKQVLS